MGLLSRFIYAVASIVLCFYIHRCFHRHDMIGNSLGRVFICGLVIVVAYSASFYINDIFVMSFCHSFVFIFIDWLLYFLIIFIYRYTNRQFNEVMHRIVFVVLIIDSIILLVNPFTGICMDYGVIPYGNGIILTYQPKFLYNVHLCISYLLVVNALFWLSYKCYQEASYYKVKYYSIIVILGIVIIMNAVFLIVPSIVVDYSTLLYGLAAFLVYHATFDYVPGQLVRNLRGFVDDNLSDATLIYDNEGNLLSSNALSKGIFSIDTIQKLTDFVQYIGDYEEKDVLEKEFCDRIFEVHCQVSRDNHHRLLATVFILHDITALKEAMDNVHTAAIHDSLTGIYNRAGFIEQCNLQMSDLKDYVLLVCAIENFRGINSLYGTIFGDKVLCTIADMLNEYSHDTDIVYGRSAESKFAVLLHSKDTDSFIEYMSHISVHMEDAIDIHLHISFGYCQITDRNRSLEFYYEHALMALSKARNQFELNVVEYDEQMEKEIVFEQQLILDMNEALTNDEFFFVLQPQIDMKTKKVLGAEALVRWNHPKFGRIPPIKFIPLFERNGFIVRVDQYIWEKVCQKINEFEKDGTYSGYISVNVSQVDIENIDVTDVLTKLIRKYDVDPSKLHVEITESACAENREVLIQTINSLQSAGFSVEIDDFGSGYSSLNALTNLPFDTVKLDMKFMENFNKTSKSGIIMNSITSMIHKLDATIIVEGIETKEQETQAMSFNCNVSQGYLYSKPLEMDDFLTFVSNNQ